MFHVVLFEPEIPANTGNIIRLCANTGAQLHLIKPLGFELDDKKLRRAGLDYHEWAEIKEYNSLAEFVTQVQPRRVYALTTKGQTVYRDVDYQAGDALLFGPETRGLPEVVLQAIPEQEKLYLPMVPKSRSLNLSNTVAIVLYEAWQRQGFISALIK